jgi:hypothetical protein
MALSKNGVHTAYLLNLMVDHHFHHSDFKCARKKPENQTPRIFTWFVSNFAHGLFQTWVNLHMVCFKNESQETHQTSSRYLRLGGLVHHHHLRHHRGSGANSAKLCRAATGGGAVGLGALSKPVTDRRWIHTDGMG